jgi:hypothetical protein
MSVARIVTTGTGDSDQLNLSKGEHVLIFKWAGTPGSATLQVGYGSTFVDAEDEAGPVTIAADMAVRVPGGCLYQVNVATHTSVLTVTPIPTVR